MGANINTDQVSAEKLFSKPLEDKTEKETTSLYLIYAQTKWCQYSDKKRVSNYKDKQEAGFYKLARQVVFLTVDEMKILYT